MPQLLRLGDVPLIHAADARFALLGGVRGRGALLRFYAALRGLPLGIAVLMAVHSGARKDGGISYYCRGSWASLRHIQRGRRLKLFFIAVGGLALMLWKREKIAGNAVGYGALGLLTVFFIFGTFDPNFRLVVTKPDNVPIVGLIFLLVFFVWYSLREGVLNDRRIAAGQGPIEKAESDRVWVWPDLVYTELISRILCSVVLIVWSIVLKAPLEQPANPANTPNPSKAPCTTQAAGNALCISIRGWRASSCRASSSSG